MKKAVIFDMDGVLVDSQPFHFAVDQQVLKQCNVEVEVQVVESYAGMSNPDRFAKYKQDFGLTQSTDELIHIHVDTIMKLLENTEVSAVPGIPKLLETLQNKGVLLALASSSSPGFIRQMLNQLGIADYFSPIVSGEDMQRSKPFPDIFLTAAKKMGVAPSDCVVIEDSYNGVCAAVAAQMTCVGFCNPNSGVQDLSAAHITINQFQQLLDDFSWLE